MAALFQKGIYEDLHADYTFVGRCHIAAGRIGGWSTIHGCRDKRQESRQCVNYLQYQRAEGFEYRRKLLRKQWSETESSSRRKWIWHESALREPGLNREGQRFFRDPFARRRQNEVRHDGEHQE